MKYLLCASLLLMTATAPAIAGYESMSTESGDTEFVMPIVNACYSPRAASGYTTKYLGKSYQGNFWPQRVDGCRTSKVEIYSYFEEKNVRSGEWCRGSLKLTRDGRKGSATWSEIEAVPGYRCTGVGETITMPLTYDSPEQR